MRLALWSLVGPGLFFTVVLAFSVAAALGGVPAEQIGAVVSGQGAAILATACLGFGLAALALPLGEIWTVRGPVVPDLAIGAALGAALAFVYLLWLSPGLTWAQGRFGDYVPAGAINETLSDNLFLFGLANVVLAPVVEETVYRGYLLPRLIGRLGSVAGVAAGCIGFGLLHWLGGVWYMLLTGLVAGGLFATLRLWRGSLVAPFAAHLTLNLLEFVAAVAR